MNSPGLWFLPLACAATLLTTQNALCSFAAELRLEKTKVFVAGHDGYFTYRIPALCVTPQGTVIAAAAGRFDSASDWANADLVIRRSLDGGRTWLPQEVLVNDGSNTVDNPTFIVDSNSGAVHLMYQIRYARAYLKTSVDEGAAWSPPVDITATFETFRRRDGYDWEVLAMGPGHGITLRSGRMVVPVWLSTERRHRPSISATIYSDDSGASWKAGATILATTDETPNPSEHQLVELDDGRVLSNLRTESSRHRRVIALSPDGADRWTEPEFAEQLYEPICMGSIASLPRQSANAPSGSLLAFANPDSGPTHPDGAVGSRDRRNLTVKFSSDGGRTWPRRRTIESGPSGYSDMAITPSGDLCLLYESERRRPEGPFVPATITFTRFNINAIAD